MASDHLSKLIVPRSAGTLYGRRVRQGWQADRDFRILSIDGGGIRGILPLAVMAGLERECLAGKSIAGQFDLVAGTSTGGIIALGLASGLTATELLEVYIGRGGDVFPDYNPLSRTVRGFLQLFANRCDTDALYRLIDEVVGGRDLWESRCRLCIPAAETRYFEPFIFKTPHHPDYRQDWRHQMAHVAKTTSAAPAHFKPAIDDRGYEFIDGGIWANNPIMVAVADALACFDIGREQIKVLSLGCGKTKYEMSWARRAFGGLISWRSLMFEAMDIQSHNVTGQARLICGGDNVLRLDAMLPADPIELWNWARAKAELPQLGEQIVQTIGDTPSRMFFADSVETYHPIYTPQRPPR